MKKFYEADPGDKVGNGSTPGSQPRPDDRPGYMPPEAAMRDEAINKMQDVTFKTLREMRVKVDSLRLTTMACIPISRYVSLAVTSFQSARQMLGVVLGERGAKYPYFPDDTNKTKKDRADKGEIIAEVFALNTPADADIIAVCKKLRGITEDTITDLSAFIDSYAPTGVKDHYVSGRALTDLVSAKQWLGEIIGEIAEKTDDEKIDKLGL